MKRPCILKCIPNIMSWTFEMHTKHHELNLKHENKTLIRQTFCILIPQASWFPRHWIQQWPRLIEVVIGRSTSHHIQPHWIIKFPQRHWCCRASFMRCQTSHQPSHALFALASIGNLCFYFPPHSGFGDPMHRWQHCCRRCRTAVRALRPCLLQVSKLCWTRHHRTSWLPQHWIQ